MAGEQNESIPQGIKKERAIVTSILEDLRDRRGFEYDIESDVEEELLATLEREVGAVLGDSSVAPEGKAQVIAEKIVKDLSDRRGIKNFFNALHYDDDAVAEALREHPDLTLTENDSRSGIQRQLAKKIEPLLKS